MNSFIDFLTTCPKLYLRRLMKLETDIGNLICDKYRNYFTINLLLLVTHLIGIFRLDSIFYPGWLCSIFQKGCI